MESKRRTHGTKWVDIDRYTGEFAPNGPLMELIIEYLLEPGAAFAYGLRFPGMKILTRLAARSSATGAMCIAVQTHNKENADFLKSNYHPSISWGSVTIAAARMGNISIMKQIMPLCSNFVANQAMVSAGAHLALPMMEFLASRGGDAMHALAHNTSVAVAKKALKLGASIEDVFLSGVRNGSLPIVKMAWKVVLQAFGLSKKTFTEKQLRDAWDATSNSRHFEMLLARQIEPSCRRGRIKMVRFLIDICPGVVVLVENGFIAAARAGRIHVCRFLLKAPKKGTTWSISNPTRMRAIDAAAIAGHVPVLRFLQQTCPHVWTQATANIALTLAAEHGHVRVSELLLAGGPGISGANNIEAAFSCASAEGRLRTMRLLKDRGATEFLDAMQIAGTRPAQALLYKWIEEGKS